ncbi:alpha/beta fold hydrolase [Anaerosporobacter faecicola]|uniref:alpha/beta fold hydrolase n=1 Tax=Anaerosporobacter faecicola TaxID=2718714 RepID=UPI001EE5B148|nr:alpha/beta hydrolase [Anaerosporobacter faecicola]
MKVNHTSLSVMIRGNDKDNPVVIFVHGGPCNSEIPYIRKYQDLLEEKFTIVHYDQRGSGKSYQFGRDYSKVSAKTHVQDLIALTEYVEEYLHQEKVILIGHSYGTYIATMAASERPDLYQAYVGIGQMSDTISSELDSLHRCIEVAKEKGEEKDATYLASLAEDIQSGEKIVPRQYLRKYGFAARKIDENKDYVKGFLFGTEYNLLDTIRFYVASIQYQDGLIKEALENPITEIVQDIPIPVYFVMGKYDGMTSPKVAEEYLNTLGGESIRQFVLFEESAHYPQLEEKKKFFKWMCATFLEE